MTDETLHLPAHYSKQQETNLADKVHEHKVATERLQGEDGGTADMHTADLALIVFAMTQSSEQSIYI